MIWQVDFYRRPLQDTDGQPLWELLICDPDGQFRFSALCPQSEANALWIVRQFQTAAQSDRGFPDRLQVFRPQSLSLIETAAQELGLSVEPTRRTIALKQFLLQRAQEYPQLANYTGQAYQPIVLDQPPPLPLPETLWGDRWRFAALPAGELVEAFSERMIPFLELPDDWVPIKLGLASTQPVPGVVIDGGRRSLQLARWLQESRPVSLNYIPGAPDGLILTTGLVDRWVVATFDDPQVQAAAQEFERRKQASRGLQFLLVQPDDAGMTYTGFWLLRQENDFSDAG